MTGYAVRTKSFGRGLLLVAVGWMGFAGAIVLAQAPAAATDWQKAAGGKMEFELASVRENKAPLSNSNPMTHNFPWSSTPSYVPTGGRFVAKNAHLEDLIGLAYKLTGQQIKFGLHPILPAWALEDRFDIEAKTAEGMEPTKDQMRLMLQALLADRFKLKVRFETKESTVYALRMVEPGKPGPTLKVHPADKPCTKVWWDFDRDSPQAKPPDDGLPLICSSIELTYDHPGTLRYAARSVPISEIAKVATLWFDDGRTVLDQTGLDGTYDLILEFSPNVDPVSFEGAPNAAGYINQRGTYGPELRQALKKQLGLKLDTTKGPVQIMVIDHIEYPSSN